MRQVQSFMDVVAENAAVAGAVVLDVGCGTGEMVRWLAGQGARVIGLDTPAMLRQATASTRAGSEEYVPGSAEHLPVGDGTADLILYFASLHHVPLDVLADALRDCWRALRPGGRGLFVEPVAFPGSYYEIVRLVEDEAAIQRAAYAAIRAAATLGFRELKEEFFYVERSFEDYIQCLSTFVDDLAARTQAIDAARCETERRAAAARKPFQEYRYRSTCRLNVLQKPAA